MADVRKIQGFDPAAIEREVDEEQGEMAAEQAFSGPSGEGASLMDAREAHAEPPAADRGYRNLNE